MKRAIFSLFMGDVCDNESSPDNHWKPGSGRQYVELYDDITSNHTQYANDVNATYMLASNTAEWQEFKRHMLSKYPWISMYNVINYFKFYMAEKLVKTYDQVLYVDFDAFFNTKQNFFDHHWFDKYNAWITPMPVSPSKEASWNADVGVPKLRLRKAYLIQEALQHIGIDPFEVDLFMINCGVMGFNKKTVTLLNFWDTFTEIMPLLSHHQDDCVDSEVVFAVAAIRNNLSIKCLDVDWNYRAKTPPFTGKICHFTNKEHMKNFFV